MIIIIIAILIIPSVTSNAVSVTESTIISLNNWDMSKYTAADKFSKWLKVERETNDIENINKFIDAELNVVRILILEVEKK